MSKCDTLKAQNYLLDVCNVGKPWGRFKSIRVFLAHFSRFLGIFTTALGALMTSCDYDTISLGQDDPYDNHDSNFRQ